MLEGAGEYTDKNGTVTKTFFHKDVQFGRIIATQANGYLQVGCMFNGEFHGHATFFTGDYGVTHTNCMCSNGAITRRGDNVYSNDRQAFFQ